MKIVNILVSAFRALQRNKLRSFLTMLGIIIGVGAVIAMLAIGQGAEYSVKQQIAALGTNVIMVFPGAQQTGGVRISAGSAVTLTEEDAAAISKECPAVEYISPGSMAAGQIIAGNLNWSTSIQGVGVDYLTIREWPLAYGEFFTDQDVKSAAKVCVVGQTVADNLFPDSSPVDQTIRIRNVPFKVTGVLLKKGQNALGQDQDDIIIAPYTTVIRRLSHWPNLRFILVSAASMNEMTTAQSQITDLLRMRHKIQPTDADDFTIRNQTDLAATATATTEILTILLASIASVSLLVGGIGIMNIMLVSVTERTRRDRYPDVDWRTVKGHPDTVSHRGPCPQSGGRNHRHHSRNRWLIGHIEPGTLADDRDGVFHCALIWFFNRHRDILRILSGKKGRNAEPD